MRNRTLWIVQICLMLVAVAAWGAETANPRTMTFAPVDYKIPKVERLLLDNGIPVYLLQDRELPIVSVTAMLKTGSVYDPPGKSGLAALTGMQIRGGGTAALEPLKLDDELEFMASSVESSFGSDSGSIGMTCLTRNTERTVEIFADLLFRPRFDPQRLEVARRQLTEAIRRQNDDPKGAADRELGKALYAGHPLGIVPTKESVSAIARQDLLAFHNRFVRPDNMVIGVAGDFDREKMILLLNRLVGSAKVVAKAALPEIKPVKPEFSPEILYAAKQVNQSVIRLGHLGITKDDPDLYAIRVLDFILGGSFTSRLVMEIRTNQGLAYNVGSHFDVGRRFNGTFTAETETKSEATAKAISLMRSIIEGIRCEPVTSDELKLAKESIVNSFLFGFTTPGAIVSQKVRLELYGYQPDFLERYRERIESVTKEDVLRAAQKHLHPDAFKMVIIGDENKFDRPLSVFGKAKKLELN